MSEALTKKLRAESLVMRNYDYPGWSRMCAEGAERIAELEAEIRELKAWAGKNEGLMQAQDRVIEAVSKKVTELEAENADLKKAVEFQKHIFQLASEHRDELEAEIAELSKDKERLDWILNASSHESNEAMSNLPWTRELIDTAMEAKCD